MTENGGGKMKSAIELAMERTAGIEASGPSFELTQEQKARIREINLEYDSKVAEVETRVTSELRKMAGQYGEYELAEIEQEAYAQLRMEKDRINEERRAKLDPIYEGAKKGGQ